MWVCVVLSYTRAMRDCAMCNVRSVRQAMCRMCSAHGTKCTACTVLNIWCAVYSSRRLGDHPTTFQGCTM